MSLQPQTLALHGGHRADSHTGAVAPPIYFTTSYHYPSAEYARSLFALEVVGYTYTRTSNPSRDVLERRVAAFEGGKAALAMASGVAAVGNALLSLAQVGDNIVFARQTLRGGGRDLATQLRRFGIKLRDAASVDDFVSATDARTRLWFAESLDIPSLQRFPIAAVARAGRTLGVPLVIDNSTLPLILRPLEEGAAVVVYSAAAYLSGHSASLGGVLVDGGNFSWESARFPTLHAPDPSYHGVIWTEVVRKWNASPLIAKARGGILRDLGAAISPMAVVQILQGLETLPLRMRAHAGNAARVFELLASRPEVAGLTVEGGLVGFEIPDPQNFVAALSLFQRGAELGDLRSSVAGPTHADSRIVLSVGVEHADDILADLSAALNLHQERSAMTLQPETIVLHAGYRSDPTTTSVAVPIYQTTSYQFRDTEHAANLFGLAELGNIYTRLMNPTNDVLEQRLSALEGGVAALAVASGQAASTFSILNVAQAGDNFVTSTDLYGGTWNLFANTFKQLGIEARFVDPSDPENFRRAADSKTRAFYAETLPNPKLQVFPIPEVARIGEELGIPLIIDNTAAPIIARPFDHGAHIIVYSTTKYIGGHGVAIGGAIIDSGKFDWEKHAERFPLLNQPDPSYHGAIWTQAVKPLGPIAYILRARVILQRDIGAAVSPFNAFQTLQGLETLPLRMREHNRNAIAVAAYLAKHPKVIKVIHPSVQAGEPRRRADAVLKGGYGGLVGFELQDGKEAGKTFIDALKLFYHVANIGDARSLAIHPATTTHSQLSPEDQLATGVSDGYVRLSVGIEHIDDILADLAQALEAV